MADRKVVNYMCPNCGKKIKAIQRDDGVILASCCYCKTNIVSKMHNKGHILKRVVEMTTNI